MSNVGKRLAGGDKTPKPPRKGKLTRQQIILIVVAAVLAVALAVTLALRSLFVRPELPKRNDPQNAMDADGDGQPDEPEPIDYGDGIRPRGGDGERKSKDYWTVLILGRDTGGGGNTDTMLLASYDVTNQKATVMSIPRDTMVNVPWDIKRINSVYNHYGQGEKGIQYLYKEIAQLVGFEPDFQVVVEWEAVGKIVDAMGGVYFDVPRNMNYEDPYQDLKIHQTKGYRLLSGDDAMQVIRWRKNNGKKNEIGDTGRQQIQQDFLKAVAKQCLQIGNWTKISDFAKIFFKNVETDIPLNNLLWFAQKAMGVNMDNVNFYSLPGNDQGWYYTPSIGENLAYFFADAAGIVELMNEHFNPYSRDITESDLQIIYKTKNAALAMTNGTLADPKMAQPSVKPKSSSKPSEEKPKEDEPAGEPVLPDTEEPVNPGTTDPGSTDATTPGTTDPGTVDPGPGMGVDPGTTNPDPGTTDPEQPSDPGVINPDPGVQPPDGGGTMQEPPPETDPPPEPELPPEPALPEE